MVGNCRENNWFLHVLLQGMKQSPIVQSKLAKFEYRMKPLIAAEATTFVLIQKVAKNQVIRKASLPHKAIALQIRQNLGCYIFTLLSLRALAFTLL